MIREQWYKKENGKFIIELSVDNLDQLYDTKDPNPYRIKDLDDDVVEYIISSCHDIGKNKVKELRIIVPYKIEEQSQREVQHSIKDYFDYRTQISYRNLKVMLANGFKSLTIGITFLIFAIISMIYASKVIDDNFLKLFIKESFVLVGWVSMWKPVNIFLYEWWPIKDNIKLFGVLKEMHVDFRQKTI